MFFRALNKTNGVRLFRTYSTTLPQNLVEKIAQKHAVNITSGTTIHSGDFIKIEPSFVMTHDNTAAVMNKFSELKNQKIADPKQVVFTLDHNVQDKSENNLKKYKKIESFAKENGIDFYKAGRGIGHQVMCEEGYVFPNRMVVASDSHSNMYGGLGCLGTPVVRTDAAVLWATSKTWWQVPPVAKCELKGSLKPGVYGKDVIIALCGLFNKNEVLNHAVEFSGEGIQNLDIDSRLTIANMTTEWGALVGLFPADSITMEWYQKRSHIPRIKKNLSSSEVKVIEADKDANYSKVLSLDLSTVQPYVCGPNSIKDISSVADLHHKKIKIHKAYIVSCVNSRLSDLEVAAKILKNQKVAAGVELYVAAASSVVEADSRKGGSWDIILDAGAKPLPPGCGPCIGLGMGLLEDDEVGISATNRNFKGRMGSSKAFAYLASPEVVAASAVAGFITGPGALETEATNTEMKITFSDNSSNVGKEKSEVKLIPSFPAIQSGNPAVCYEDNINTDVIYPGKYTYNDNMTPSEMAQVVMENYDSTLASKLEAGDILIGGYNFGTGSSREQAVTALKHAGISLLIAGSFSETYKRNALNNGLLAVEVPELVNDLKSMNISNNISDRFTEMMNVNYKDSSLTFKNKTYNFSPVGEVAQELIAAGNILAGL